MNEDLPSSSRLTVSSQEVASYKDVTKSRKMLIALKSYDYKAAIKRKLPILSWLPTYTIGNFFYDFLGGLIVALALVPQGIAYAIAAGLPTQYGLYCGFMAPFVYVILGSCKNITIGPSAILAFMMQPHITRLGEGGAVLITFLSGCIITVMGVFHWDFLVEFFSYPIISAFTTASGATIAMSQLRNIFGLGGPSRNFVDSIVFAVTHITETRKWDATLGLISIVFLLFATEIRRFGTLTDRPGWSRKMNNIGRCIYLFSLASNAITVTIGTALGYIFYTNGQAPFLLTGNVEGGLPPFAPPPFTTSFNGTDFSFIKMLQDYGTGVLFCPLVSILAHLSIVKAFSKGKSMDTSQELIALGISNIMGSFVRSMPVTGSSSRTAVNHASGVRTPAGGVITGGIVLLALAFLTNTFEYMPKATLAAVIIVDMYYLCDFATIGIIWKTKKLDMIPFQVTVISSIALGLEWGILFGVVTNLFFLLYAAARPKLDIEKVRDDLYLVKFKTGLYYSAAEYIRIRILEKCVGERTTVILDGKYLGNIDATVAKSFGVLREELEIRNQKLVLMNFKKSVMDICIGVNKKLQEYFKDESLEQIIIPLTSMTNV